MNWMENKKAYTKQYAKDNLKRVPLDLQKEEYEQIKDHAAARSETVNGFIKRSIRQQIERDNSEST